MQGFTEPLKNRLYWHHSDYLGSAAILTDQNGRVSNWYETVEGGWLNYFFIKNRKQTSLGGSPTQKTIRKRRQYAPFGEILLENSTFEYDNPYKFNAKELDAATGLYYYGARYYDPRTSVWLSVDPLVEKYPSFSPYVYVFDNPIKNDQKSSLYL